jgi:hypothetical protein
MDQTALVTDARAAGRELVGRLKVAGFPVSAALWYWDEEAQEERLAVVSPLVDEQGPRAAYERIAAVLRRHPEVAPLSLLARISVIPPAQLRTWLTHGLGFPGRFSDAPWIEGGSPARWLARQRDDRSESEARA